MFKTAEPRSRADTGRPETPENMVHHAEAVTRPQPPPSPRLGAQPPPCLVCSLPCAVLKIFDRSFEVDHGAEAMKNHLSAAGRRCHAGILNGAVAVVAAAARVALWHVGSANSFCKDVLSWNGATCDLLSLQIKWARRFDTLLGCHERQTAGRNHGQGAAAQEVVAHCSSSARIFPGTFCQAHFVQLT